MKDRIRQLMESQHLSQQEFADKLKISPASLSSIFNDRTRPTLNHVDAIKRSFPNVNLGWLLYGDGEMFVSKPDNTSTQDESRPVPASHATPASNDLMLDFGPATSAPLQSRAASIQQTQSPRVDINRDFPVQKIVDIKQRKISEIRIFYDDQTWETFIPKK